MYVSVCVCARQLISGGDTAGEVHRPGCESDSVCRGGLRQEGVCARLALAFRPPHRLPERKEAAGSVCVPLLFQPLEPFPLLNRYLFVSIDLDINNINPRRNYIT